MSLICLINKIISLNMQAISFLLLYLKKTHAYIALKRGGCVGIKYHVIKGEDVNEYHELNDDASLLAFLDENNQIEGELFASDFQDIKLSYNTHTGSVKAISNLKTPSITFFYPAKSFHIIITPIKNILDLRNKRDFLLELCQLGLMNIIAIIQIHIDDHGRFTRKLSLNEVDSTLLRIQQLAHQCLVKGPENHRNIYEILSKKEMLDIKSREEAQTIINKLKENQIGVENKVTFKK